MVHRRSEWNKRRVLAWRLHPRRRLYDKILSQLIGYDHVHNPWGFINFFKNYGKNAADVTSTYAYPGSEGIVFVSFIGGVVPFIGTLPRCLELEREAAEIARQKYGYGR